MVDYVIVGAGSAGCVLAARLTENPSTRVLLLEAGGPDARREIRIPAAWSKLFRSEVDWDYSTSPQTGLGGRRVFWPRGKTLGGSSSVNTMMAIPGHRADYDGWADLGNEGWSFDELAPQFRRLHQTLDVEELRDPNPLTHAFIEAAERAGIPRSTRLGPTDLEGVRLTPVTQRRGRRWSSADAYLRPALGRRNLTVVTDAHATRVLFEGERAVGVAYRQGAAELAARCSREVILCGAARWVRRSCCSSPGSARPGSSPSKGWNPCASCRASGSTSRITPRSASSWRPPAPAPCTRPRHRETSRATSFGAGEC